MVQHSLFKLHLCFIPTQHKEAHEHHKKIPVNPLIILKFFKEPGWNFFCCVAINSLIEFLARMSFVFCVTHLNVSLLGGGCNIIEFSGVDLCQVVTFS